MVFKLTTFTVKKRRETTWMKSSKLKFAKIWMKFTNFRYCFGQKYRRVMNR